MSDQLNSIQTHLWILTALIGLYLVAAIAFNLARYYQWIEVKKMQRLADTERYSDLLAMTMKVLMSHPGDSDARIYQALALYGLDRPDEARSIAADIMVKSPLRYADASAIVNAIDASNHEA